MVAVLSPECLRSLLDDLDLENEISKESDVDLAEVVLLRSSTDLPCSEVDGSDGVENDVFGEEDLEEPCAIRAFGGMLDDDLNFLNADEVKIDEEEKSGIDEEKPVCCERFRDDVCFLFRPGDSSGLLLLRLLFFRLESLTNAGFMMNFDQCYTCLLYTSPSPRD